jgi:hypothetical protein
LYITTKERRYPGCVYEEMSLIGVNDMQQVFDTSRELLEQVLIYGKHALRTKNLTITITDEVTTIGPLILNDVDVYDELYMITLHVNKATVSFITFRVYPMGILHVIFFINAPPHEISGANFIKYHIGYDQPCVPVLYNILEKYLETVLPPVLYRSELLLIHNWITYIDDFISSDDLEVVVSLDKIKILMKDSGETTRHIVVDVREVNRDTTDVLFCIEMNRINIIYESVQLDSFEFWFTQFMRAIFTKEDLKPYETNFPLVIPNE